MNFEKIILFIYNKIPFIKNYRLQKLNKYLKTIDINDFITLNNLKENKEVIRKTIENKDKEYNQLYENFKKVLEQNFESDDLHNFYYNSEWVRIYKIFFNPFKFTVGTYNYKKNQLHLNKKCISDSINHELFHLSSTNYGLKYRSTGFCIEIGKKIIGAGLNEGYTDLLTQRYFDEDIDNFYYLESIFASKLEEIIGQATMEKLYLKGDFFVFIKELEKYYEVKEIERFLINIDIINLYYGSYISDEEAKKINLLIEDCICFLLKGFCKILKNQNYPVENKKERIQNYFDGMNLVYKFNDLNYKINIERINKVIEDNLTKDIMINYFNEQTYDRTTNKI